jgi:ATP-binding cassette subfamily B protein
LISALRFVLTAGPRIDRVRSLLVMAVAILEPATGIGLALLLGLFSEAASRHSTSGMVILALCVAIFVMLTQGTFIAGYFTRLRLQEEIRSDVERQFINVVGTTPTLEIHERPGRAEPTATVRGARGDIGAAFDRLLWLAGAALALIASAVLMASVVPVLAALPLFAVPAVLATQAADAKRGQAVRRAMPRTRLAGHLFTLATTAATGRETRLFGLASELRDRHREEWDAGGRDIARTDGRARVPVALAWLFFVLAYAAAITLMVRAGLAGDASLGLIVAAIAVTSQLTGQVQGLLTFTFWTLESLRAVRAFLDVVEDGAVERAAMRQAPLLRVLDEPTASLDARAEEWLFQRYADLSRADGGVTVLVTHRFTTARAADLIVVLDGGRVVEVGTHDTLSQADGLYAELFRLQARYFV